jgi:hypothetical protein
VLGIVTTLRAWQPRNRGSIYLKGTTNFFSSQNIHVVSGAHTTPYPIGNCDYLPRGKEVGV